MSEGIYESELGDAEEISQCATFSQAASASTRRQKAEIGL